MTNPVAPLRLAGIVEGISLLLLFGVAMPLKYAAGMPQAVSVVGMAHGLLWLLLLVLLARTAWRLRWPLARILAVFIASLLPFGFLVIDRRLRAWGAEAAQP